MSDSEELDLSSADEGGESDFSMSDKEEDADDHEVSLAGPSNAAHQP
jgi:hypothetical protein